MHIPVVLSKAGFHDMVYNDFFVGEGADVTIVAGCGIHNCGDCDSEHDGIHTFYIGKIAGEQLLKLETLGLTPEEAEEKILEGFLR